MSCFFAGFDFCTVLYEKSIRRSPEGNVLEACQGSASLSLCKPTEVCPNLRGRQGKLEELSQRIDSNEITRGRMSYGKICDVKKTACDPPPLPGRFAFVRVPLRSTTGYVPSCLRHQSPELHERHPTVRRSLVT